MDNRELVLDKIDELLGEVEDSNYSEALYTIGTIKFLLTKLIFEEE